MPIPRNPWRRWAFFCALIVLAALLPVATAPAVATQMTGEPQTITTDWIFPSEVSDGLNYDLPENILSRDGQVAHTDSCCGLITAHSFTPLDIPAGTHIDKVELRFHLAGVQTTARFMHYHPSFTQCIDHERPGYYKDFRPASETVIDDYFVEYTDQDCSIGESNVRDGTYYVQMVRYIGSQATYTIDDISVRFTYTTPGIIGVSATSGGLGTHVTATYPCAVTPTFSMIRADGDPADRLVLDSPVTADGVTYTQDAQFTHAGDYIWQADCAGQAWRSPVISIVDPNAHLTDWLFPHTVTDGVDYQNLSNVLARDGNVASIQSQTNGRITLRHFDPVTIPAGAAIARVELRFHLSGFMNTGYRFQQYSPNFVQCLDHTHPSQIKTFIPHSEFTISDHHVGYTDQDCIINPDLVRSGDYEVGMLGIYSGVTYSIDDISVRFTYVTAPLPPQPAIVITPATGLPGTIFTANYSCPSAPSYSLTDAGGQPVSDALLGIPVTGNLVDYQQTIEAIGVGGYLLHVTCGTQQHTSAIFTVTPPPIECRSASLLGVRGSGDNDHGLSHPGEHAIEIARLIQESPRWSVGLYDPDGVPDGVTGVTYPAVEVPGQLPEYGASVEAGADSLLTQIDSLRIHCGPRHAILLTGYSQGAHVIQTVLQRLDDEVAQGGDRWKSIAGVALLASPRFDNTDSSGRGTYALNSPDTGSLGGAAIPGRFAAVSRTYCLANDPICVAPSAFPNFTVHTDGYDPGTLTGVPVLNDATGLLAHGVVQRLGGSVAAVPTGMLVAKKLAVGDLVLISASAVYANGAPSTVFQWDFNGDGSVDFVSPGPLAVFENDLSPPAKVTATVVFADGSEHGLCIKVARGTSRPC